MRIYQRLGEPLRAAYINTKAFVVNKNGYPVLTKAHQQFLLELFEHNIQVIIAGHSQFADGLVPYQYYIRYLFNSRRVKTQQEQMEQPYRDYLQSPLQPLSDHLESQTYETFERDPIKYAQYEEAVYQALMDRFSADETAVLMVVGAGRGPLVKASLRASARAQRKLRVYAVEKNPNAVVTLRNMKMIEWGEAVTVVSHDMRTWQAPEKADILVSELLGSFGDNELSPECLDGAQKFLKDDGISIPCNSVSYIAPMSSAKLWSEVQGYNDLKHFETSYVVKLHNFDLLAPPQPCFRFVHPNEKQFPADYQDITPQRPDYNTLSNAHFIGDKKELTVLGVGKFIPPPQPRQSGKQANDNKHDKTSKSTHTPTAPTDASTRTAAAPGGCIDNSRYQRFRFKVEQANTLHGFAGYFDSRLYKDVHISIYPDTFSPGMFSWFPLYFPLRCPIHIPAGTTIEVHFWRVVSSTKVWFEWCVTTPTPSAIHNAGGRSSHIGLAF